MLSGTRITQAGQHRLPTAPFTCLNFRAAALIQSFRPILSERLFKVFYLGFGVFFCFSFTQTLIVPAHGTCRTCCLPQGMDEQLQGAGGTIPMASLAGGIPAGQLHARCGFVTQVFIHLELKTFSLFLCP